ncbi:hypothetical protein CTI12_AA278750 [Artemisia annua]|uniref:Uncharacterized protein n=1 Tax=Artemisia annua TaxID=35608 RepID=A0A2U1NC50_ARTAN|nr:hypothetical protein CTI12_AA278750 [Artemisia annua]
MATKPMIPTPTFTPKPSTITQNPQLHTTLKPFKPFSLSSSSLSIKCTKAANNNNIENVKEGLMDLMSGMVEEMLKTEDADTILSEIMGGVSGDEESRALFDQILERIDVKKEFVAKKDGEIRKMRCCVKEMQVKDTQLEKCQKELAEARALVEEAKRSLKIVKENEDSMKTESQSREMSENKKRLESLQAAAISALIDIVVKVSAKVLVAEAKHRLEIVFEDKDSVNAVRKSEGTSRNKKRLKSLKFAAMSAFVDTLVNALLRR